MTVAPESEAAFQKRVQALAAKLGWHTMHIAQSTKTLANGRRVGDRGMAGFPDLFCIRERIVYVELKAEKGRLSDRQKELLPAIEAAGGEVYVWRPSDWDEIVEVFSRRVPGRAAPSAV